MKIEKFYFLENNEFSKAIQYWAEKKQIETLVIDSKKGDLSEIVDAVALFHENHNFSKDAEETHSFIVNNNRPGHKVDINGTLAATASNFAMWLERNSPKNLLIIGSDGLSKNENLSRFLSSLEK